jgi:ADP-heptose:LPS heptosyltransferase
MKTITKIWLDKHVIGLTARLLNYAVIILGKVLRIDHSLDLPFKVLAVCKYKGMGSIIQSIPLLSVLRNKYPDSKIIYVSSKENADILKQIPVIDEIIWIDDSSFGKLIVSFFPFIRKLQSRKIEVYIDLEVYSNFSTLTTICSLSKNRMGFYLNSMHYRLGNYTQMMYYNTRHAIPEIYLQFARLLNCECLQIETVPLDSSMTVINLPDGFSLDLLSDKYILINPNASDLRIERRWSDHNFVKLIQLISKKYPSFRILLIGSAGESAYVKNIMAKTGANVQSLAGKTSIPALIALIKHAHLFITNDSGPLHIALSTQTPTVAMFGPCSPNQYKFNLNTFVVYKNVYCSPCVHEFVSPPCKGNNYCMKTISVESVFQKVVNVLEVVNVQEDLNDKEILFKINNFTIGTLDRKNHSESL